jgi:hypothetical protein
MKNTDPLMGANESKKHAFVRLASEFSKSANMTQKKISKNAEFHADFESTEKVVKNAPKKLLAKM